MNNARSLPPPQRLENVRQHLLVTALIGLNIPNMVAA